MRVRSRLWVLLLLACGFSTTPLGSMEQKRAYADAALSLPHLAVKGTTAPSLRPRDGGHQDAPDLDLDTPLPIPAGLAAAPVPPPVRAIAARTRRRARRLRLTYHAQAPPGRFS